MNAPLAPPARSGRTVGYVHTGIAIAIAVLVAAVALTTRQPPPPEIAEFAPQAVEQIKEAPKNQISDYGSGEGDCPPEAMTCELGQGAGAAAGGAATSTTGVGLAPPVIDRARAHKCVGNPPRQIEDPQSPPCIPYWDDSNGNGGATAPGVTTNTITVSVGNEDQAALEVYVKFFNERFELYGRKIKLVADGPQASGPARADNARELKAFGTIAYQQNLAIYERLAKHKIIGISRDADFTDAELARLAPYVWSYPMSATQQLAGTADWLCARLVGRNAEFAGTSTPRFGDSINPVDLKTQPRRFAAYLQREGPDAAVNADLVNTALGGCGAKLDYSVTFNGYPNESYWANEMVKLKEQGITTVLSFMEGYPLLETAQAAANKQGYFPEWVVSSYPHYYVGYYGEGPTRAANRDQLAHTMALFAIPMDRVTTDLPNRWAWVGGGGQWSVIMDGTGTKPGGTIYRQMLLLASGIQMAGPNLTPQTFAEGLHKAKFPNPDTPPIKAGKVGFDEGDYSMTNDFIEAWWDVNGDGPYWDQKPGDGTFCYDTTVGRRSKGGWPRVKPRLFDKANCDDGNTPVA